MIRLILILVCGSALSACSKWTIDTEWKHGEFRLIAIDATSQMSLIHEQSPGTLVGPTIFAVGADERYIVLKQHPALDASSTRYDRTITNYFVVGRDKQVRGPLKKAEFEKLTNELSLPPFSKIFDDLQ